LLSQENKKISVKNIHFADHFTAPCT